MKFYKLIFYIAAIFIFAGCGEDDESIESVAGRQTGWHNQGRDCLACHNLDLGADKKLAVAGSMFKNSNVSNFDDLNNMCDADMAIEFLDANFSVAYTTADYYDANSKGYLGRGNIFLLDRLFNSTLNGSYRVRVVDRLSGLTMAQSAAVHDFSGADYSIEYSDDANNRLSCNACHNGGVTTPLYVQLNNTLCK